jgi:hypothetical protein
MFVTLIRFTGWMWWCASVIPAFAGEADEDHEFEASLGYIVSLRLV